MTPQIEKLKGLHIVGEIFSSDGEKQKDVDSFRLFINTLISHYGLNSVGQVNHQFENGGFTTVVCLTESHISIHTWPEFSYITCDIYLCNFTGRNNEKCEEIWSRIVKYFNGNEIRVNRIER